jgi:type IV pilus assembly protein PilE
MRRTRSSGFTLLELLIAVVVVGILAAIAIPSYSAYVIRGQRAAAKAALEQAAQWLERNYTTTGCYNFTVACSGTGPTALPAGLTSAPNDGPATYAVTVTFAQPAGFVLGQYFLLTATPCGAGGACPAPSNSSFADSECGALTLDSSGTKGAGVAANAITCWQR